MREQERERERRSMLTYEAAVGHSPVCLKLPVPSLEPAEVRDFAKVNVFMLKRTRRHGMSRTEMPSPETEIQTPHFLHTALSPHKNFQAQDIVLLNPP